MGYLCLRVPVLCGCVIAKGSGQEGDCKETLSSYSHIFSVEMLHSTWLKVKEDSGVLMAGILFSFPPLATVQLWP